ncbi:MAG: NAD-dependent epimerase/dehydratase family protein [Pirellulales bacterium]
MRIEQISGDLRDAEAVRTACKGQEAVIHTAAIAGIGGRWNDYFAINTQGTYNILLGLPKPGNSQARFLQQSQRHLRRKTAVKRG